jgi:hypothetical protein
MVIQIDRRTALWMAFKLAPKNTENLSNIV